MKRFLYLSPLIAAAGCLLIGGLLGVRLIEYRDDYAIFVPLGIVGAALWIAFLFRPLVGYTFFILALPFQSEDYAVIDISGAVIRPCDLIALPVFLGWLFSACFVKKEGIPFQKSGLELPLFAFAAFAIASTWWSTTLIGSVSKDLQLIYAIILFYMCKDLIKTERQLMTVFWAWVFAGSFLAGTTIYDALGSAGRASSDLSPNSLVTGEILNYPIFLGIGLFWAQRGFWAKVIIFLLVSGCAAALIATGSRGPTLGFGGAMIFLFIVSPHFHRLRRFLPSFAILASLLFAAWCVTFGIYPLAEVKDASIRFIQVIQDPMSDLGVRFRVTLWAAALELFTRFPIIGIGVGSLGDRMFEYTPIVLGRTEVLHFMYLEMLVLFGCLGFLLFAWLFIRMVRISIKTRREVGNPMLGELLNGVNAALIAQAIGWLTYGKFIENRVFWVCFALVFSISLLAFNENKKRFGAPLTHSALSGGGS